MKVLLTGAFKYSSKQLKDIKDLGLDVFFLEDEKDKFINSNDIDIVVCNELFLFNDINQFTNLKFIQVISSGLDRLPMKYIKSRNISISNAKGIYSVPMAEWVILKILEIYKNTSFFKTSQSRSEWVKNRKLLELNGKSIGIIGTGSVGIEVAKRAKAFGCTVVGLNTSGSHVRYFDKCIESSKLNFFLSQCDVIVITVPLTDETRNMININTLNSMKQDAVLINVSRGGIVNEFDLLEHLNNGMLKGVALDVFEQEPLPLHNPLWTHPRVLITPHNSFISDNVSNRLFELIYKNLMAFIENRPISNEVGTE